MSVLIWLVGPSGIGKSTLAEAMGRGDAGALAAFGLDAPPLVHVGRALAHDGAPLCGLLADPVKPVVVKHQYHYGTVVRAAATLAATRLHRLALLWCAPAEYARRYDAKYPGRAAERSDVRGELTAHWLEDSWPHVLRLHAALVSAGASAAIEIYDNSGTAPLRVWPACVVGGCECGHVDPATLTAMLLALRDPWALPGPPPA